MPLARIIEADRNIAHRALHTAVASEAFPAGWMLPIIAVLASFEIVLIDAFHGHYSLQIINAEASFADIVICLDRITRILGAFAGVGFALAYALHGLMHGRVRPVLQILHAKASFANVVICSFVPRRICGLRFGTPRIDRGWIVLLDSVRRNIASATSLAVVAVAPFVVDAAASVVIIVIDAAIAVT